MCRGVGKVCTLIGGVHEALKLGNTGTRGVELKPHVTRRGVKFEAV